MALCVMVPLRLRFASPVTDPLGLLTVTPIY